MRCAAGLLLASDAAAYVTGHTVPVDGCAGEPECAQARFDLATCLAFYRLDPEKAAAEYRALAAERDAGISRGGARVRGCVRVQQQAASKNFLKVVRVQ